MQEDISYNFSPEKNKELITTRNISFEEIIAVLHSEGPITILKHPSPKYSHQKIYVVSLKNYTYMVPFVETNKEIFLKTAYPSRKAMKMYVNQEAL